MLSSIFSSIGGAIGNFFGGGLLSTVGKFAGKWLGNEIESKSKQDSVEYYKICKSKDNIFPVSFAHGKAINLVFGMSKCSGHLIWSDLIKEVVVKEVSTTQSKNLTKIYNDVSFLYYCNFAVSICEGKIEDIHRFWINNEIADLNDFKYRLYKGGEDQVSDILIKSYFEEGKCPAFKDLSYIVFEDFPLLDYGNSIPLFEFEVERKPNISIKEDYSKLEDDVKGVNIIPGSGEYVYDTDIVEKNIMCEGVSIKKEKINSNNKLQISDVEYSLNYLNDICPNVEWVSPVVCWFGNSTDIKDCEIYPAVENKSSVSVKYSKDWSVSSFTRETARVISKDELDSPNYGGSVNDESVVNYLKLLKSNGKKIMFYPMIFMDVLGKPWRGHLTGDAMYVTDFFEKELGYNNFILHYANLVKGHVDAFLIGSELIGITKIKDSDRFPAIDHFIDLARRVREILGPDVLISYAADWSEYHHTSGGWYNLDKLWASENIDFIGIDNYMPVTDCKNRSPTNQEIKEGFFKGEGVDFYINSDGEKCNLDQKYAWKNIKWWWENEHINPNGVKTEWTPKLKKIWFTEYGFPSIDKSTNQPNVFYDPASIDGGVPKHSNGEFNLSIQRHGIKEFISYWGNKEYVENMFLWCFDARPYPKWPHSKYWKDWRLWKKGHWINGKFGKNLISEIILEISERSNILISNIDCSELDKTIYGLNISSDKTSDEILSLLKVTFGIEEIKESLHRIKFQNIEYNKEEIIDTDEILPLNNDLYKYITISESKLQNKISIKFNNIDEDYSFFNTTYISENDGCSKLEFNIPISLTEYSAYLMSQNIERNLSNNIYNFTLILPRKFIYLSANDTICIKFKDINQIVLKINNIAYINNMIYINCFMYDSYDYNEISEINFPKIEEQGSIEQIHLPCNFHKSDNNIPYYSVYFVNYYSSDKFLNIYNDKKIVISSSKIKGNSLKAKVINFEIPDDLNYRLIDKASYIDVVFDSKVAASKSYDLKSAESMIIVSKLLIFFNKIEKLDGYTYRLSNLIYHYDEKSLNKINVGDDLIFCSNYQSMKLSSLSKFQSLFIKDNQEYKRIII